MDSSKRMNVRLFAAVVGGSAVVALGALSTAIVQQQSVGQDLATGGTVGAFTSTEAAPQITGAPAWPSGEVPNRIP